MFSHGLGIVSPDGELGHLPFFGGFAGGAESSVIPWTDLFKSLIEARSLPRLPALSPLCGVLPPFFLSVMNASHWVGYLFLRSAKRLASRCLKPSLEYIVSPSAPSSRVTVTVKLSILRSIPCAYHRTRLPNLQ